MRSLKPKWKKIKGLTSGEHESNVQTTTISLLCYFVYKLPDCGARGNLMEFPKWNKLILWLDFDIFVESGNWCWSKDQEVPKTKRIIQQVWQLSAHTDPPINCSTSATLLGFELEDIIICLSLTNYKQYLIRCTSIKTQSDKGGTLIIQDTILLSFFLFFWIIGPQKKTSVRGEGLATQLDKQTNNK